MNKLNVISEGYVEIIYCRKAALGKMNEMQNV